MEPLFSASLDYDPEGDVLYISFGEPQAADDADISEDDIIVRTRAGKIVGLTILNARATRGACVTQVAPPTAGWEPARLRRHITSKAPGTIEWE